MLTQGGGEARRTRLALPWATLCNRVAVKIAKRKPDNKPQICVWTNQYGKGRVFATTVGHYNETMAEPKYLDMVTRGLLWSVNRLDDKSFRKTDDKTDAAIKALIAAKPSSTGTTLQPIPEKCCGVGNLAFGKPATASSEEKSKNNLALRAVDGDPRTRWCANGGRSGQNWQVDLGEPQHDKELRIHWEKNGASYRYLVDASADAKQWKTIVDQSKNKKKRRITKHKVDAAGTKFLRVTFLGSTPGYWGSFWEFEVSAGKLPELPPGITVGNKGKAGGPATVADVTAPPGFNVTLFGVPPDVNYPVCLTTAPTGCPSAWPTISRRNKWLTWWRIWNRCGSSTRQIVR